MPRDNLESRLARRRQQSGGHSSPDDRSHRRRITHRYEPHLAKRPGNGRRW